MDSCEMWSVQWKKYLGGWNVVKAIEVKLSERQHVAFWRNCVLDTQVYSTVRLKKEGK